MKNIIITLLLLTGTVLAGPNGAPTIDISQSNDFKEILKKPKEIVLFVPAGTALNLSIDLDGNLARVGFAPATLTFERDLYFYAPDHDSRQPLFSWDGETWKPLTELVGGSLNVGLEGEPQTLKLNLTVHSKES